MAIATTVRRLRIIADWFEHGCKEISRDCQEAAREDVSYAAAALAAMAHELQQAHGVAQACEQRAEQAERERDDAQRVIAIARLDEVRAFLIRIRDKSRIGRDRTDAEVLLGEVEAAIDAARGLACI